MQKQSRSQGRHTRTTGSRATQATRLSGYKTATHHVYATARKTATTAKNTTEWLTAATWKRFSDAMTGLEQSTNYYTRKVKDVSGIDLSSVIRQWRGYTTQFNPTNIVNMAQVQKAVFERDLNKFAHNFMRTVRHTSDQLIPTSEELIKGAKRNLSTVYDTVKQSPIMHQAKSLAHMGKSEIMSFLNIPSQSEVEELQRKINTLEQRVTTVMLRGARNNR